MQASSEIIHPPSGVSKQKENTPPLLTGKHRTSDQTGTRVHLWFLPNYYTDRDGLPNKVCRTILQFLYRFLSEVYATGQITVVLKSVAAWWMALMPIRAALPPECITLQKLSLFWFFFLKTILTLCKKKKKKKILGDPQIVISQLL